MRLSQLVLPPFPGTCLSPNSERACSGHPTPFPWPLIPYPDTQLVDSMEGLEQKEEEIKHLKVQLVWSEAQDKEKERQEAGKAVARNERQVIKIKEALVKAEEMREGQGQRAVELEKKVTELKERTQDAKRTMQDLKTQLSRRRLPIATLEKRVAVKTEEIKKYLAKKKVKKKEMEEEQERLTAQSEADLGPLVQERKELEDALAGTETRRAALEVEQEQTLAEMEEVKKAGDVARFDVMNAQGAVKRVEKELHCLGRDGAGGNNPVAVYGEAVMGVVREIQRQKKRFREVPVGPIGLHVKVKDGAQEWAGPVENAIAGMLSGFIVTSHEDRRVLQDVMRNVRQADNLSVYTVTPGLPRHVLQTSRGSNVLNGVPFHMVADCVAVDNDYVWNCLVDWAKMDGSAVTQTTAGAKQMAGSQGRFPAPIKVVYDMTDYLTEFKNKSCIQRFVSNKGRRRLGMDSSAARLNLQRDLASAKAEAARVVGAAQQLDEQGRRLQTRLQQIRAEIRKMEGEVNALEDRIRTVKYHINDASQAKEAAMDLEAVQREIDAYDEQVRDLQTQQSQDKAEKQRLEEDVKPLVDREADEAKRSKALEVEVAAEQALISECLGQLEEADVRVKKCQAGLLKAQAEGKDLQEGLVTATTLAEEAIKGVRLYTRNALGEDWNGEDVIPSGTWEQLTKKLKEKERRLVAARAQHQTRDSVATVRLKMVNAYDAYVEKKRQIEAQRKNLDRLEQGLDKRKRNLRSFRKYIVRRATIAFDTVLQHKGSAGKLDFKNRVLEMEMRTNAMDESSVSKNVKELSGGERSFTTLAFLIALGDAIESPFRIMDEFDIFMDAVARKTALDLLVKTATREDMQHRQFIFITPQDLGHVRDKVSNTFKIHKLLPPERSMGVIQQTILT